MSPRASRDSVETIVHDLGIEIENGEDALFVIGRLDALASAIVRLSPARKRTAKAALLPDVLRRAAKQETSKDRAKSLRRAARLSSDLLAVAEEVSYGELHEGGVRRAEELRSELYDLLYELMGSDDDDAD